MPRRSRCLRPSFAVLCTSLALSLPAAAETLRYDCRFATSAAHLNWLPETVQLTHVPGEATAVARDPMQDGPAGGPFEARVETDNAKRSTFTLQVKSKSSTNQPVTVNYRLTVMKADLTATLSAKLLGYTNHHFTTGRCKRREGVE